MTHSGIPLDERILMRVRGVLLGIPAAFRLNTGRRISLRSIFAVFRCSIFAVFAILVISPVPIIGQELDTPAAQAEKHFQAKKQIVTEPDGRKVALVRWAIGSRDNVTTLRIPLAYVPILGDDRLPDPFATVFVAEAMLWNMGPVPRGRSWTRADENQRVSGLIESRFAGTTVRNEVQQLRSRASIRLAAVKENAYQLQYSLRIVQKPEHFGLKRIGAVHNLGDGTPVGLKDFYYVGDDPEQTSDFMTCTDEAVPDDPPPNGRPLNPGCEQWFAFPSLSATVKLNYRRRHLSEWSEIKRLVINLIESWK